jgi:hypothetical protein
MIVIIYLPGSCILVQSVAAVYYLIMLFPVEFYFVYTVFSLDSTSRDGSRNYYFLFHGFGGGED